jgi:hypothetical protein
LGNKQVYILLIQELRYLIKVFTYIFKN